MGTSLDRVLFRDIQVAQMKRQTALETQREHDMLDMLNGPDGYKLQAKMARKARAKAMGKSFKPLVKAEEIEVRPDPTPRVSVGKTRREVQIKRHKPFARDGYK